MTKREVKMSKFFFFCVFVDREEVEVHKNAKKKKKRKKKKKNEANIQPSWPNKLGQ